MAYWHMTKKLTGHHALEPGEVVAHAVYGLGKNALAMADSISRSAWPGAGAGPQLHEDITAGYVREVEQLTQGADSAGFAAEMRRNGVLAVTDRRLLFFAKSTVVGKPKELTAAIDRGQVVDARYESPVLAVRLADGSVAALHVPRSQSPLRFLEALGLGPIAS